MIHILALLSALGLVWMELQSTYPTISESFEATKLHRSMQMQEIGFIAYILLVLCIGLFFILWRASKHAGTSFETFIQKNFNFMRNIDLLSDLLIKFCFISVLFLSDKTEWISALLVLFIADFLIQGKVFRFSLKFSYTLGIILLTTAFYQFHAGLHNIKIALGLFVAVTALSLAQIIYNHKAH